jgi:pimeloyl-ACP methyl ester carboxylesterase
MNERTSTFVLVPGMWLGGWAWDEVAARLRAAGHDARPVTLTGVGERVGEDGPDADLERHARDVIEAMGEADDVVLVGHSYGGLPVTMAADREPDRVARVVYVESGPLPDGSRQIDFSDPEEKASTEIGKPVPSRPWDPDDDPVLLAGLDERALSLLRSRATTHPYASVTQGLTRVGGRPVPMAMVACTYPVEQVQAMVAQGHPMFALLGGADLYGLPTGHWPMLSEPERLAALLDRIAKGD